MYSFDVLKEKLNNFINNGGNIYLPRRELPYYSYMHKFKRELEIKTNKTYEMTDIYQMCGIKFNKDYFEYCELVAELEKYKDENNYIDSIKKTKKMFDGPYSMLKNISHKHQCNTYDFVVFMTDFKLKDAIIQMDYVAHLKKELLKNFPDRDLTGIKQKNIELYDKIRHFRRYSPIDLGMQDTLKFLGFKGEGFSNNRRDNITVSEKEVVDQLNEIYPDKHIVKLTTTNPTLYQNIIKLCLDQDKTTNQWFNEHGFTYIDKNDAARLSRTKVDAKERYDLIQEFKENHLSKNITKNLTDEELFELKIKLLPLLTEELDKHYTEIDDVSEDLSL